MFKFLFDKLKLTHTDKVVVTKETIIKNKTQNEVINLEKCTKSELSITDNMELNQIEIIKNLNNTTKRDNLLSEKAEETEVNNNHQQNSFEKIINNIVNSVFNEYIPEFIFIKDGKNVLIKLISEEFDKSYLDNCGIDTKIQNEILSYLKNKNDEVVQIIKDNDIDNKKMAIKITNSLYKSLKNQNYYNYNLIYGKLFNSSNLFEELVGKYMIISKNRSVNELTYLAEYIYRYKLNKKYFSYENINMIIKQYENKNKGYISNYYMDSLVKDILKLEENDILLNNVKYFDNDTKQYELGAIACKNNTIVFFYNEYKITTSFKQNEKLNMEVFKYCDTILVNLLKDGNFVTINGSNVKLANTRNFIFVGKNSVDNYDRFYNYLSSKVTVNLNENVLKLDENSNKYGLISNKYDDTFKVNRDEIEDKLVKHISEEKLTHSNSNGIDKNLEEYPKNNSKLIDITINNNPMKKTVNTNISQSYYSGGYYGTIVTGHYRRTKSGKVTYVRTHRRR